ncbi:hypothetical protein, partial [Marinitenerispora sediminis]
DQLQTALSGDTPELATTLPAPAVSNLNTPLGDATGPVTDAGTRVTEVQQQVDETVRRLKGGLPGGTSVPEAGGATTLPATVEVPSTESLPDARDVQVGIEDVRSQVEGRLPETSASIGAVELPADQVTSLVEGTLPAAGDVAERRVEVADGGRRQRGGQLRGVAAQGGLQLVG